MRATAISCTFIEKVPKEGVCSYEKTTAAQEKAVCDILLVITSTSSSQMNTFWLLCQLQRVSSQLPILHPGASFVWLLEHTHGVFAKCSLNRYAYLPRIQLALSYSSTYFHVYYISMQGPNTDTYHYVSCVDASMKTIIYPPLMTYFDR